MMYPKQKMPVPTMVCVLCMRPQPETRPSTNILKQNILRECMISSFPQPFLLKPANEIYRDDKEKINRIYPSADADRLFFAEAIHRLEGHNSFKYSPTHYRLCFYFNITEGKCQTIFTRIRQNRTHGVGGGSAWRHARRERRLAA